MTTRRKRDPLSPVKQARELLYKKEMVICLSCDKPFMSTDRSVNRRCKKCVASDP